jgi:hypothetical protein
MGRVVHFIGKALVSLDPPEAVVMSPGIQEHIATVLLYKNKAIAAPQGYLFAMPDPVFAVPRISELFTLSTVSGLN